MTGHGRTLLPDVEANRPGRKRVRPQETAPAATGANKRLISLKPWRVGFTLSLKSGIDELRELILLLVRQEAEADAEA